MSASDVRAALERLENALAPAPWTAEARRALADLRAALESDLPREIERKYLLARAPVLPPGVQAEELEIEQGWLPGLRLRERLRRVRGPRGLHFERALKVGAGLERIEVEEDLDAATFASLWPATAGCRVLKRRTRVREGLHLWEIDAFLDRPLFLAEVELADAAERPAPPAWLSACIVREVTDEPGWTNLALAQAGTSAPG